MVGRNLFAICLLLCATRGSAGSAGRSKSVTLQPWLIGLSAVVGFLGIVFIILILKTLLKRRREAKEKRGYGKSLSLDHVEDKETVM
ncbi:hypothetical protein AMECASPLE_033132 [Ameca splendens]|uniref:Uncharacterized protein n=1 Tax=Ameca splendens TaxID=208324 RepID=A0ABV0XVZ6_9TELE